MADALAIVTGANGGIGLAVASTLHRDGYGVALFYNQNRQGVDALLAELGGESETLFAVRCDMNDMNQVAAALDDDRFGRRPVQLLINNAGYLTRTAFVDVTEADYDTVFNINMKSVYFLTQQVAKRFMIPRRRGSIVNIASATATCPGPYLGAYGISKAALVMFTKVAAQELGAYDIRVNAISPGLVRTPMSEPVYQDPEMHRLRLELIAVNRVGHPDDVAAMVSFLCDDRSAFITGQNILVDGGSHDGLLRYLHQQTH